MAFQETKFKTVDGTELHGRVYPAAQQGPGLVMCPGFNCILTMLNFPACAAALQRSGITVLLYDPRNTGASGGQPRNDIDPPQAVADLSDALTHLLTLPSVGPAQAGLLGLSFGGTVGLSAAAVDPRCRFVVAVAPLADLDFASPAQRARVLRRCMQDRASQVLGNPPFAVPVLNDRGENPVGFGHGIDSERYARLVSEGREIAPGHVNRVTLMTYYKLAMWTPWPLWRCLGWGDGKGGTRGAMFVIPEKDAMSYPHLQRKHYDELPEDGVSFRKSKMEVADAGHEDVLGEAHLETIVKGITEFVRSLLDDSA
ncbi:Alpha/Beta hydrolase protein [Chaetomidium leptoderma]|uniref:Alpha/Beta hydrolase protein n=1 Tax=Chaetomidium leptoderma TaxID=669021 RepID=A0AAN6VQU4_9PEZI|nr:Alpha/Beta hydrolase protein [Chaetomidium leptoderma]